MEQQGLLVISFFDGIRDSRIERNKLYPLPEILLVAFATILSGGETYYDMQDYGEAKLEFFKTFLPFNNGIPSEDTYERVLGLINPKEFQEGMMAWTQSVSENSEFRSIAIDGKALRGSRSGSKSPLHMMTAWASHNRLVIGSSSIETKRNEITAIPEILKILNIKGTTITIDAIGCQTAIAQQIVDQGGDFALALKKNQKSLYEDVKFFFEQERAAKSDFIEYRETTEKGHGRIEKRLYGMCSKIAWLKKTYPQWNMVKSIGFIESTRIIKEKESKETRYYVISYTNNIDRFSHDIRSHWGVENNAHWLLDVVFREDQSRIRNANATANVAILRRMALNKFELDKTPKRSKRRKRLLAGWDDAYLKTLLTS